MITEGSGSHGLAMATQTFRDHGGAPRTAVVTGAASARGIGRATAHRLARDGWSIAIVDLDRDAVERTAAEIAAAYPVRTLGVAADISDEVAVDDAIAAAESRLPPIVGLANIA